MLIKKKAVVERVRQCEDGIRRAKEYLDSGEHSSWVGFRPLFVRKLKAGKELPPHRDWVRNVYLPRMERELARAEKVLEQLG
jgi:hypothetical protein